MFTKTAGTSITYHSGPTHDTAGSLWREAGDLSFVWILDNVTHYSLRTKDMAYSIQYNIRMRNSKRPNIHYNNTY